MADSESKILRRHYEEMDFISSPEGILKILSVVLCILSGAAGLARAPCGSALGGGAAPLAAGAALAALSLAALLAAPRAAPLAWLYTDSVVSTAAGVVLLAAVLAGALCSLLAALDYIYVVCGALGAALAAGSAVAGYVRAARRLDAAAPPPPPASPPRELDV